MSPIQYIDRQTGQICNEKVYGAQAIALLYGRSWMSRFLGSIALPMVSKLPFFSALYGWWQSMPWTRKKIRPFIESFGVDETEFLEPVENFSSFNDFFIRKLKPSARPLAGDAKTAVMPADGRYYFYQDISRTDSFSVKGERFCLKELLQDASLAERYQHGSMVMARLCPSDYHRFHFPADGVPSKAHLINGWLYSVNPVAIKRDIHIFTQNKRMITTMNTTHFGKVLYIDIGATNVGSIHQTFTPEIATSRGAEKGYFSFGASSLILLFEPGAIKFDSDLVNASSQHIEIRGLMGQSMGQSLNRTLN